jgi:AbrB family looped-hinge helix DNA binding protein
MTDQEEPDIVVVSSKGQVVIPQAIRERLSIGSKTKLLVYSYEDGLIMKKIKVSDSAKEMRKIFEKLDRRIARHGELSEKEIKEIVQKHRIHRIQ